MLILNFMNTTSKRPFSFTFVILLDFLSASTLTFSENLTGQVYLITTKRGPIWYS